MPALIDPRLCDSSPYCSAARRCPKGAIAYQREQGKVTVNIDVCNGCVGYCARACPMNAIKFAPTMEELRRLESEILNGPSAEELFEQQYGVKPVDPRAEGVNLVHADESNFGSLVLTSSLPVAVDFWAAWCAPCKILAPTFKELAEEYDGKVRFVKVDTEESSELARRYGVMSIPTVGFFVKGQMVDRSVGAVPKAQLKARIEAVLRFQEVNHV